MSSFFSRINPLSRYSKQRRKLAKALRAESKATMAGLRALKAQFSRSITTVPNLRRSIHVLEKGLCFPDRKKLFGLKFIGTAVNLYAEALANSKVSKSELNWASEVLTNYFEGLEP